MIEEYQKFDDFEFKEFIEFEEFQSIGPSRSQETLLEVDIFHVDIVPTDVYTKRDLIIFSLYMINCITLKEKTSYIFIVYDK